MPTKREREAFIEEAVRRLREEDGAERVVLFGSSVDEADGSDSDVDLLVVLDTDEPRLERWLRIRRLLAGERQPVPFDLILLTPDELEERLDMGDPFIESILEEGRTLHAA